MAVRIIDKNCSPLKYGNDRITAEFLKDDCCTNETGDAYVVVVERGFYTASTKAQANILAQQYILNVGQNLANANGTCTEGPMYDVLSIDLGSTVHPSISTNLTGHNGHCPLSEYNIVKAYNASATIDSSNNLVVTRSPSDFVGDAVIEYERFCSGTKIGTSKILVNFTYGQSGSKFATVCGTC